MKRATTILATLALLSLGLFASSAAHAEEVGPVTADEASYSAPTTTRWVDNDGYIRLPISELEALAATQTPAEIQALVESGHPLNTLIDPSTGEFIAAAVAEQATTPIVTPFTVSVGCGASGVTTVSRYWGGGALATCFSGIGYLSYSLPNTYYISAGNADVYLEFQGGGGGVSLWAYWAGAIGTYNFQSITRSIP